MNGETPPEKKPPVRKIFGCVLLGFGILFTCLSFMMWIIMSFTTWATQGGSDIGDLIPGNVNTVGFGVAFAGIVVGLLLILMPYRKSGRAQPLDEPAEE